MIRSVMTLVKRRRKPVMMSLLLVVLVCFVYTHAFPVDPDRPRDLRVADNLEAPDAIIPEPQNALNLPDVRDDIDRMGNQALGAPNMPSKGGPGQDAAQVNGPAGHLDADHLDIPNGGEMGAARAEDDDDDDMQDVEQPQLGAPVNQGDTDLRFNHDDEVGAGMKANDAEDADEKDEDEDEEDDEDDDDDDDDDETPVKQTRLKLDDLQPPDHLDAVRMEQDGHLNRDYRKEIFLGNHEEFEEGNKADLPKKLTDIFNKVDTSADGFISQTELEEWILIKIQDHFDEATEENEHIFKTLDTDKDGFITWDEFHIQFLVAKGFPQDKAEREAQDYGAIDLEIEDKEQLIRYKFRWADADEEPQDNKLTQDEFKFFRHPEQSPSTLNRMVDDIMENIDHDRDDVITEEEFIALPMGDVDEEWKEIDKQWQEERRKEFRQVIDLDKSGKVTAEELKKYVDPKNPNTAIMEAKNLIQLADTNNDHRLALKEVLDNTELFLGSKMVNTGRSFHDEF